MDALKAVKSVQEQAVASWINYLNQMRIDRLMDALTKEQENLENAIDTITETLTTISREIVHNGLGRGGEKGIHGFIAEVAEVGIGNARALIEGNAPIYEWINDNGPEDLRRGVELIQQKFVQSGGHLSLQAIRQHLEHYPAFIENGGKYQIPADHYEKIQWLLSIPENEANKMSTSMGEFSLKQWREVHDFFKSETITIDKLEPSALDYKGVQKSSYEQTLAGEKKNLRERNQERRNQAYQESKPSLAEGMKTTAIAAAVEGGVTLCIGMAKKRREGKQIKDFNRDDWTELADKTGLGSLKGGIRGSSVYLLTNYSATPVAVASAIVTASFGVAEQAHRFRKGESDEAAFIENSELLCLDAAVNALSSFAGQVLIPVPIIGAVIGTAVGTMMYQFAMDSLSAREQTIFGEYLESLQQLGKYLDIQYQEFILGISENMKLFMETLDRAFAPDVRTSFAGSAELARAMGVPMEEILDSRQKVMSYFLD